MFKKKGARRFIFWLIAIFIVFYAIKQVPDRYQMAASAFRKGNHTEAPALWGKMAKLGNAEAQYNLGALYAVGKGVEASDNKAYKWFLMAAENGIPAAQFEVGKALESGRGVSVNPG